MAGMRIAAGSVLVVAGAVLALLVPAGAHAGTYDVVSCRAPGADGINRAWVLQFGSYPDNTQAEPGKFNVAQECPGPRSALMLSSIAQDGIDAGWARSASLRLDAPPGTSISRVRIWRHGQSVRADAADGGGDEWDVYAQTDDGNLSLEGCVIPAAAGDCNVGAGEDPNGKGVSNASLASYDLDTAWVLWGLVCNPSTLKNCPTASGAGPRTAISVFGVPS